MRTLWFALVLSSSAIIAGCTPHGGGATNTGGAGGDGHGGSSGSSGSGGSPGSGSGGGGSGGGGSGGGGSGGSGTPLGPPWERNATFPLQHNNCKMWARNPPDLKYLPPLPTPEGIWAAGVNNYDGVDILMRKGPNGWRMETMPGDVKGNFFRLEGNDAVIFVFIHDAPTVSGSIRMRAGGAWSDIADPSAPVNPSLVTVSGSTLIGHGAFPGEIYRYDGSWAMLPKGSWTTPHALWGTPSDLYVAHAAGLQHFDGTAWKELAPGFPTSYNVLDVAGTAPGDVYAITATNVYHVEGSTLKPSETPFTSGCNAFAALRAAGSNLVLTASGGPQPGGAVCIWQRRSGAWAALPPPPFPPYSYWDGDPSPYKDSSAHIRPLPDGTVTLGTMVGTMEVESSMSVLTGNAWVPYPIEAPAPQRYLRNAVTGKDVYVVGDGISKLVGDAWQPIAGTPPDVSKRESVLWQAPDGTLFLAAPNTNVIPNKTQLWRLQGGAWSLDATLDELAIVSMRGRSSSDVLVVLPSRFLRWNGSTWSPLTPPLPPNTTLVDAAYAGTSWLIAQFAFLSGGGAPHLLEYDGVTWTDIGPTGSPCCMPVGPAAAPHVFMPVGGGFAVRDQSGWSMLPVMAAPDDVPGPVTGPAPDRLYTRMITYNTMAHWARGIGALDANHTWVSDFDWVFEEVYEKARGKIAADDHVVAMPIRFAGIQKSTHVYGGDAVTVCDIAH